MYMNLLRCPVCREPLQTEGRTARRANGRAFDFAKEGYINLLAGSHKAGSATGDSRTMALARRAFLDKGYFAPLRGAAAESMGRFAAQSAALDICCGEGYYSSALRAAGNEVYAFDLSKEMVRLAARRGGARCFVANISAIPLPDECIHAAIHLFAPFHDAEFSRILRPNGALLTVVPGRRHLMGMKEVLYDAPYENDEAPPTAPSFVIAERRTVRADMTIRGREDIAALLNMTPYGVRSPRAGIERLLALDELHTPLEFILYILRKRTD